MIQDTSLEAYHSIEDELNSRQYQIWGMLKHYRSLSNLEISRILGIPINCVTPRVKELRNMGLVVFSHKKKDRITGRNVMVWKVKL